MVPKKVADFRHFFLKLALPAAVPPHSPRHDPREVA